MGFSRQDDWGGLPCPPPGDFPDPGIEPASLLSVALAGGFFTTSPPVNSHWRNLQIGHGFQGRDSGESRTSPWTAHAGPFTENCIY